MATATAFRERTHQVAGIGCGPVGTMLANFLGLQGISTRVLERGATSKDAPRSEFRR